MLTYNEAVTAPDKYEWQKAIEEEKKSLIKNNIWKLADQDEIDKNKRILTSRWIFRKKDDGIYKARLVARGCEQKQGINYEEAFSPVVNSSIF